MSAVALPNHIPFALRNSISGIEHVNWRSRRSPITYVVVKDEFHSADDPRCREAAQRMKAMNPDLDQRSYSDAVDCDTRDGEVARRNLLFGLWAGNRLGFEGDDLETYAWSVHLADHISPGHDDVIAKVAVDFASRGEHISDRQLRSHLREMTMRANLDLVQQGPRSAR
jgi:hypothetical protein